MGYQPGGGSGGGGPHSHTHSSTTGQTVDDHHAQSHAHDGLDSSGTVAHGDLTGTGTDDHHAASHAHGSHTGVAADDHHAQAHGLADHASGSARISADLEANRPATATADRLFFATDTNILYRDTGAAWEEIARSEDATRLAQLSEKAHGSLTGTTADDHHGQSHGHTGADGSGSVAHADATGQTADDHHAQSHGDADHTETYFKRQVETKRVATGNIGAGVTSSITVTWDTAFPDTNYTVVAVIRELGTNNLEVENLAAHLASSVEVRVRNRDGINGHSGTVHAIAIAD